MMKRTFIFLVGVCFLLTIAGCSVGMALSGKKEPNLGAFHVGSTRGEAELQLGKPVSSVTAPEGNRTDIYEYELGNEPSAGRAIGHGVMDVLTLGLWEVVGTPVEGFTGSTHRITIVYGPDDRIVSINQAPVPSTAKAEKKKEDEADLEGFGDVEVAYEPRREAAAVKSVAPTGPPEIIPEVKPVTGTCFTANQTGTLLTAYHVVKDATSIRVRLADGTVTDAKLQSYNPGKDLAILRIDPHPRYFLPLAQAGSVSVGERVFTMGYPAPELLGGESKFTEGTISALSGPGNKDFLLQISVPIQPGNSGGPIVNERGEAVGVVTSTAAMEAFLSVTGSLPQNVNWAVKTDHARPMFNAPTVKSLAASREQAIEWTRHSICLVEVTRAKSSDVAGTGRATESKGGEVVPTERAPVKPKGVPVFAHTAPGSQVLTVLQPQTVVTMELSTTGPEGDWCYITEVRGKRRSGYVRCENLEWDRSSGSGPLTATVRLKE